MLLMEGKFKVFLFVEVDQKGSHLFFADDILLFFLAQMGDIQTIQSILQVYERASRQQINTDKTTLFFGKFISETVKNSIKGCLGVPKIKQ